MIRNFGKVNFFNNITINYCYYCYLMINNKLSIILNPKTRLIYHTYLHLKKIKINLNIIPAYQHNHRRFLFLRS